MVEEQLREALATLRGGGLVAYPTDTVYGLGANALDTRAVQRIFEAKGRPTTQPLPLLVADLPMLKQTAVLVSPTAETLAQRFLPGPLTLVLHKSSWVPSAVTGGGPTVAVRIPGHEIPRALSAGLDAPLVGTSANPSGAPSVTSAEEVRRQLGGLVDYVMDGECSGGRESTVLDLTRDPPVILRQGAIARREIERVLGLAVAP
ncbi:MAG: threonylcarbamoyl-AMP synthase [Chloroflexi bacterium]|nr:threonylcarbamoyl-AMP synthase [Chloroflexota bacterium]